MSTSLVTHCGARVATREELDKVEAPAATQTWFPLKHSMVVSTVQSALEAGGFKVESSKFALTRGNDRLFSVMDLSASVGEGVHLAVGVRNSYDKSLPLGFICGCRVFVCDNLAFRSELLVARKHTRNGQTRFEEAIVQAVASLTQFREVETRRVRKFRDTQIRPEMASHLILKAYQADVISHRLLPQVLAEYEKPSVDYGCEVNTLWGLMNAFTFVMGSLLKTNPQRFAHLTMKLQQMFDQQGA